MKWIDSYRFGTDEQPLGPHGRNNYITTLKWYFSRSTVAKLSPADLKSLKKERVPLKDRDIDEEALEHLLQFSPTPLHDLAFRLVRERGIRPHELLSLRACDVSETKEGWALVDLPETNPATSSGRNKTGARRIIFIQNAQRLLQLAHKVENQIGRDVRLFPWALSTLPVTFCRMKKMQAEVAAQEGWDKLYTGRLYDLRHAAITDMYLQGFIDQEVRALVGWSPASRMPNVYVHVQERHLLTACR